ncbi:MAG: hypothetical protein V3V18_07700, partial [Methylococcales bacterium]
LSEADILQDRNRETGGGRLSVLEKQPDINTVFLQLLKEHTAGNVSQGGLESNQSVPCALTDSWLEHLG